MKALVTGVTGLVGHHLLEQLLKDNHEIVIVGRDLNRVKVEGQYHKVELDLTSDYSDYAVLEKYGEGYHWFHVAAAISGASDATLDKVNVEGTRKLTKKGLELGITRFILVSSISTYGTRPTSLVVETTVPSPESYYGYTKLVQEEIVIDSGLSYCIVRPPYIGGPGDLNFLEEFGSRILKSKMPTFSKDGIISYVDARDLSNAMIFLAKLPEAENEAYNVVSGHMNHSEFVNMLGEILGQEPPHGPHYPYWLAMFAGVLFEIKAKITGAAPERGLSRYRIRSLCRQFKLDDSKLRSTGFVPEYSLRSSVEAWNESR